METQVIKAETKNIEELERTVFIMKRVVEKLQAENKRLLNGKKPLIERAVNIPYFWLYFLTFITPYLLKTEKCFNLNLLYRSHWKKTRKK